MSDAVGANALEQAVMLSDEDFMSLTNPEPEVAVQAFKVEDPHWRVSRLDILRILDIVSKFPTNTSIYLAIRLVREEGVPHLEILASNKDYYLRSALPAVNETGIYESDRVYFIQDTTLATLVKAYSDFVFLFDNDGNIYYYNTYVKHKLDAYSFDLKDFLLQSPSPTKYEQFALKKNVFQSVKKLLSMSLRISDSKTVLSSDKISGFFMLYSFGFQLPFSVPEPFYLRRTDLNVLASVYSYEDIAYQVDDKRVWIKFPIGEVSFLKIPYDTSAVSKSLLSDENLGDLSIDLALFKKAMNVITAMGAHVISLVQKDNDVYIRFKEGSDFRIGTGRLDQEFNVSLEVLRKTVVSLPEVSPVVNIRVTSTGLALRLDDSGLEYSLEVSRISSTIAERKNRTDAKAATRDDRREAMKEKGNFREDVGIEVSAADRFGVKVPS